MPKKRSWTDQQLKEAVTKCRSYRAILIELKLIPAGGNYDQIKRRIGVLGLSTSHLTGMGWNVGLKFRPKVALPLKQLLIADVDVQSYKLKKKLFDAGLKLPCCELCGWAEQSSDGRIPIELDHINGNKRDNRLENLRVLCPNCHSLQPTHRGRNKKVTLRYARVVE